MPDNPREFEIETFNTPKGDVPTVKGLETAINVVYKEMASLDKQLSEINQTLSNLSSQLETQNQKFKFLGESVASLLVYLAKMEAQDKELKDRSNKQQLAEKADLLALKEDLSRILEQLQDNVVRNES
ncbi:MAG: hypothetical protein ACXAC8_03415 [Candidatus Hodarchaeales archaeon]|jgi:chromosome segregation ATPase